MMQQILTTPVVWGDATSLSGMRSVVYSMTGHTLIRLGASANCVLPC